VIARVRHPRIPRASAFSPVFWSDWAIVFAVIGIAVIGGIASPLFLSPGNIETILIDSSILIVLTTGQSLVIGTAGIDLSMASVLQLSAVMIGVSVSHGWGLVVGIPLSLATGLTAGAVNGLIITKGKIADFIVTLGTFGAFSGLALLFSNAIPVPMYDPLFSSLGTGGLGPFRYLILLAVGVAVTFQVVLSSTPFGTHLLAIGGNRTAANEMGVKIDQVRILVYMLSGLLAGLGAIMVTALVGSADPTVGSSYLLGTVAAAVLGGVSLFGGRATIWGPFLGAVVLTAILNLLIILGITVFYQPIAIGIVVILSAFLRRFGE
jgi:ribose/xylose/arabinose/galactoside ABC-type transport system permease subunit